MSTIQGLRARAIRYGNNIEVLLRCFLPDSCHEATATAHPGIAGTPVQIRIALTRDEGSPFCTMVLSEWRRTLFLQDPDSSQVDILVNGVVVTSLTVADTLEVQYIVFSREIDLSDIPGAPRTPIRVCTIEPDTPFGDFQLGKRFGPATYQECQDWIAANCQS